MEGATDSRRSDDLEGGIGVTAESAKLVAQRLWRRSRYYAFALLIVAATGLVAECLYELAGLKRLSAVFLAGVLITAVRLGSRPALVAALFAEFLYNFYTVEPRYSFQIDSLEEVLTLALFLAVALLTGRLAGRVQEEAVQAKARERKMTILYSASRELSAMTRDDMILARLAELLASAAGGQAEVIWHGDTWTAGDSTAASEPERSWTTQEIAMNGVHLGVARWRSAEPSDGSGPAVTDDLARIIVEIGAAAIERARRDPVPPWDRRSRGDAGVV